MHLATIIASTVLALVTGASAWAQAADGRWIANNKFHKDPEFDSGHIKWTYHEACGNRDGTGYSVGTRCGYWINGKGKIARGCMSFPSRTLALIGG